MSAKVVRAPFIVGGSILGIVAPMSALLLILRQATVRADRGPGRQRGLARASRRNGAS